MMIITDGNFAGRHDGDKHDDNHHNFVRHK